MALVGTIGLKESGWACRGNVNGISGGRLAGFRRMS